MLNPSLSQFYREGANRRAPDGYGVYPDGEPDDAGMNPSIWDCLDFSVYPTVQEATRVMRDILNKLEL